MPFPVALLARRCCGGGLPLLHALLLPSSSSSSSLVVAPAGEDAPASPAPGCLEPSPPQGHRPINSRLLAAPRQWLPGLPGDQARGVNTVGGPAKSRRTPRKGAVNHRRLNDLLPDAMGDLERLMALVEEHSANFNEVNISTALRLLSRCRTGKDMGSGRSIDAQLKARMKGAVILLEGELVKKAGSFMARPLSSSANALTNLETGQPETLRVRLCNG